MPNNKRAKSAKQLHSDRLKQIRPYVNFNYDLRKPLSRAAKRKIKEYHDEIAALTSRPYQVYRPRKPEHLKEAQEFAQHERKLPGLKAAFIPTNGVDRVKIKYRKGGIVAESDNVVSRHIRLNTEALIDDAVAHVNARVAKAGESQFTIQAGRYEIPASFTKATIGNGVARFVAKYSDEAKNNFHGNWLHGVIAYSFKDQGSLQSYLQEKQKYIRKGKRERKAKKRKAARDRDNSG